MMKDTTAIDQLFWKIALKDDEEAFCTLFFEFFSSLCVFAHRYVGNWQTCEDIVQDTFYRIWKTRKSIDIHASGRNFLLTSVRNACVDYLRRQDMEKGWQEKEMKESLSSLPGDLYSHIELEQMLATALSKLPEHTREIFELNRFEGKTYKEIALEKDIAVKTVEARMSKALKHLRIELKDYLPLLILLL